MAWCFHHRNRRGANLDGVATAACGTHPPTMSDNRATRAGMSMCTSCRTGIRSPTNRLGMATVDLKVGKLGAERLVPPGVVHVLCGRMRHAIGRTHQVVARHTLPALNVRSVLSTQPQGQHPSSFYPCNAWQTQAGPVGHQRDPQGHTCCARVMMLSEVSGCPTTTG